MLSTNGKAPGAVQQARYERVVVLDSVIFYPEHRKLLEDIAEEVVEYDTCASDEEVLVRVKGADCIISCWVDIPNKVIEENPQLKTVAFWTHAFEHRIDRAFALAHHIHVPAIPDYGTDSVAELVFVGLLQLYKARSGARDGSCHPRAVGEEILAAATDGVRRLRSNWRDNLRGSWMHEYIKAGRLRISSPDAFASETLKGLTVGLVAGEHLREDVLRPFVDGFRMNAIYCGADLPHSLDFAFRPIDSLVAESNVVVFDSRELTPAALQSLEQRPPASLVDVAKLSVSGESLAGKRLGIVGLGRIGGRVAQIAREGFGMDVSYFSTCRKPDLEERYGLRARSLHEVLTENDVVTFHLPHVGAERVITREMVDSIPSGTTVVNVSVGSIFEDEAALLRRFREGDIDGYLDVYDTLPPREVLRECREHLIATYRLGWRTKSTIGLKTHKLLARLREGLVASDP